NVHVSAEFILLLRLKSVRPFPTRRSSDLLVLCPNCTISTAKIFAHQELTRDASPSQYAPFSGRVAKITANRSRKSFTPTSKKPADRKSTRLNSSHVKISYAVFCLKKKTQT